MLFLLLIAVVKMMMLLQFSKDVAIWIKWTAGLYAGWVTAASIAGSAVFLTSIDWSGWGLEEDLWYRVMTITAAAFGFIVYSKSRNPLYALALIWALIAIAYRHTSDTSLFYQAVIPAFFLFLFVLSRLIRAKVKSP